VTSPDDPGAADSAPGPDADPGAAKPRVERARGRDDDRRARPPGLGCAIIAAFCVLTVLGFAIVLLAVVVSAR
jgi:hypothetical protein